MLVAKGLLLGAAHVVFITALLLVPAGTWDWPQAISFLTVYGVLLELAVIALGRWAPASLEARLLLPGAGRQPRADRIVTFLLGVALCGWFISIPYEVFHWHLLPPPPTWASALGGCISLVGFSLVMGALYQNSFAAPVVWNQVDRGQVVVDRGLYAVVRHPFYFGSVPWLFGTALWLESYLSLLLLPCVVVTLVARILVEEKTLRETLPGYLGYTKRVRYRLVPGLW
jgi:protein-S-isoprenylcysteine O-methyltransferase Ste14